MGEQAVDTNQIADLVKELDKDNKKLLEEVFNAASEGKWTGASPFGDKHDLSVEFQPAAGEFKVHGPTIRDFLYNLNEDEEIVVKLEGGGAVGPYNRCIRIDISLKDIEQTGKYMEAGPFFMWPWEERRLEEPKDRAQAVHDYIRRKGFQSEAILRGVTRIETSAETLELQQALQPQPK